MAKRHIYSIGLILVAIIIVLSIATAKFAADSKTATEQATTSTTAATDDTTLTTLAAVHYDKPATSRPHTETTEEPELTCLGEFRVTAYCTCVKCCGVWSQDHPSHAGTDYVQKTASGTIPTAGRTIAADPSVLPYGTVIVVDGHEYIVEDAGSAVNGNTIDIYFSSHEAALEWGVQYKTIYIKGDF